MGLPSGHQTLEGNWGRMKLGEGGHSKVAARVLVSKGFECHSKQLRWTETSGTMSKDLYWCKYENEKNGKRREERKESEIYCQSGATSLIRCTMFDSANSHQNAWNLSPESWDRRWALRGPRLR